VREQANSEHEAAMDSLRVESDRLLASIEGAMGKLKEERDAARAAAAAAALRQGAAEERAASLRESVSALQRSGAVHRLQSLLLVGRYAQVLAAHKADAAANLESRLADMLGAWRNRLAAVEEQLAAECARSAALLQLRAALQETLTGFKRDTVLEHKVRTMELAQEIAGLADTQGELLRQQQALASQLSELEGGVRAVEREMGEVAKAGIIAEDGTVNLAVTRKKKRLDRDLDAALARMADRRSALDEVRRKMAGVEAQRADKEEALRAVEADLIATLVQQQRGLLGQLAAVQVPAGSFDAAAAGFSRPSAPPTPSPQPPAPVSPAADPTAAGQASGGPRGGPSRASVATSALPSPVAPASPVLRTGVAGGGGGGGGGPLPLFPEPSRPQRGGGAAAVGEPRSGRMGLAPLASSASAASAVMFPSVSAGPSAAPTPSGGKTPQAGFSVLFPPLSSSQPGPTLYGPRSAFQQQLQPAGPAGAASASGAAARQRRQQQAALDASLLRTGMPLRSMPEEEVGGHSAASSFSGGQFFRVPPPGGWTPRGEALPPAPLPFAAASAASTARRRTASESLGATPSLISPGDVLASLSPIRFPSPAAGGPAKRPGPVPTSVAAAARAGGGGGPGARPHTAVGRGGDGDGGRYLQSEAAIPAASGAATAAGPAAVPGRRPRPERPVTASAAAPTPYEPVLEFADGWVASQTPASQATKSQVAAGVGTPRASTAPHAAGRAPPGHPSHPASPLFRGGACSEEVDEAGDDLSDDGLVVADV